MTYAEKLKDPRWQQKRLQIFERDDWACTSCGHKEDTLHVHHRRYTREPWNTPDKDLTTLCEYCHERVEDLKKRISAEADDHTSFMVLADTLDIMQRPGREIVACLISNLKEHPELLDSPEVRKLSDPMHHHDPLHDPKLE